MHYKLTYFDVKCLGEPIRYILSYMGQDFEDVRLPIEPRPDLKKMPGLPFGRIPILEIDGKILHQSSAIMRYLAHDARLTGSNPEERLEIDMLMGAFSDLQVDVVRCYKQQDKAVQEKYRENLIKEGIPYYMERFRPPLEKTGYMANKKLSWLDLYIVAYCESFPGLLGIDLFEMYPFFKALKTKVQSLPGIKEWIKRRPITKL